MDQFIKLNDDVNESIKADNAGKDSALSNFACKDTQALREDVYKYSVYRQGYIRDCEAIMNLPQYNRYFGKTQVFSLYANNDISNRAYHVQLVSRIARTIGSALKLNCSLIEAIALAHDLGHTPFGHKGEKWLNKECNRHGYSFFHHIQGARYLSEITRTNISLQVIDGVMCHNGEKLYSCYAPNELSTNTFDELRSKLDLAYSGKLTDERLFPSTLEGCLVRLCDVIAYIGKDRQDADKLGLINAYNYNENILGKLNHEIIRNVSVDIINNSYGKNKIQLSSKVFDAMQELMQDNYKKIYYADFTLPTALREYSKSQSANDNTLLEGIFHEVYEFLLDDITRNNSKIVKKYYVASIHPNVKVSEDYFARNLKYPERVCADYLACMSDEYLLDFYSNFISHKLASNIKNGFFSD